MNSFFDIISGHVAYLKKYFEQLDVMKFLSTMKDEVFNSSNYSCALKYLLSEEFKLVVDGGLKALVPAFIVYVSLYFIYLSITKPKGKRFDHLISLILHFVPVIFFSFFINLVFIDKGFYVLTDAHYIHQVAELVTHILALFLVFTLIYASYLHGALNKFSSFVFNFIILGLYCFTNQTILEQFPRFLNPNKENIVTAALKAIFGENYLLILGDYSSIIIHSLLILSAITVLYVIVNFILRAIQFTFKLTSLDNLFTSMFLPGFLKNGKGLSYVDSTDPRIVWAVNYLDEFHE